MHCILCGGTHVHKSDALKRNDIVRLYRCAYGIDVSSLIQTDVNIQHCPQCGFIFYDPQFSGDEAFYNSLQKFPWYYEDNKNEFLWAAARIPVGSVVLEIGAGDGAFATHLDGCDYTGLDLSAAASAMARQRGVTIYTVPVEQWAEDHPQAYDVVCHFQVLEHVSAPRSFLAACAKALKPGGKLVMSLPSEDSYMRKICNDAMNMPPHHISRWTDETLHAVGRLTGLTEQELYHEPICAEHRHAQILEAVYRRWFGELPMIDLRISTRVKRAFVRRFTRLLGLDRIDPLFLGCGNSVDVVYTKPKG